VSGEVVYANEAIYANLGGDPVYSNVAEVSQIFIELLLNFWYLGKIKYYLILLPSGERGSGAPGGAWTFGAGGQNGWCRRQGSGQGPGFLPPASTWSTPLGAQHGGWLLFIAVDPY
jgi:hypothetical protein